MELEKSESVLGSLYTLRGGLSAISVERDKAAKTDEECHEKLDGIVKMVGGADLDTKDTVEYAKWICGDGLESKLQDDYQYKLNSIKDVKEKEIEEKIFEDNSEKIKECLQRDQKNKKKWLILMCSSLILLVLSGVFMALGLLNTVLFILGVGLLTVDFWVFIVFVCIYSSTCKTYNKTKQKLEIYLEELQEDRDWEARRVLELRNVEAVRVAHERKSAAAERKAVEDEYNKLSENLPAIREEARKILNERNAIISPLVESCNTYYKALTTQFTPLLDERDWQHLDLVIYQLETRRADNIKEALQLVDRELQTERLENSIKAAIKSICFTLQRGFTSLQDSININCAKISDIIISTSAEIIAQNKQLSNSLKGQLAELTDSVNVGNALQEKANESSAQLVEDVYELRRFNTDFYV